jgi:hypothetical protein
VSPTPTAIPTRGLVSQMSPIPFTRRIKMSEDHAQRDLYTLLLDRLRHSAQYVEAARVEIEDAIALIEAARSEQERDDG